MIVIDAHSENLTIYSAYLATLRLYNSIQITFPNQSLGAYKKSLNAVKSTLSDFLVTHSLCKILYIFSQSHYQQSFRGIWLMIILPTILHKILHI